MARHMVDLYMRDSPEIPNTVSERLVCDFVERFLDLTTHDFAAESADDMSQMASVRKCLYAGVGSALRFGKTTSSGSRSSSGSIAVHCTPVSQSCGSKVKSSAARSAFSPSPVHPASTPFANKPNVSGSIPGSRCYAAQIARLPGELGSTLSLIPYYTSLADSRLVARLGVSGDAAIVQGTLTHRNPDL